MTKLKNPLDGAYCYHCKKLGNVPVSEIMKDVGGGHSHTYRLWHVPCGYRLSGINERLAESYYRDIPFMDEVK